MSKNSKQTVPALTNIFERPADVERAGRKAASEAVKRTHELGLPVTQVDDQGRIVRIYPDGHIDVVGKVADSVPATELS